MRKTKEIILSENGNNFTFVIEQMPATKLQMWIIKALALVLDSNMASMDFERLQKEFKTKGFALLQGLDTDKVEPLINELYTCAKHKAGNALTQVTAQNVDSILSDVRTLFSLQKEIFLLNFDFFKESPLQDTSGTGAQAAANTFNMQISQPKQVLS